MTPFESKSKAKAWIKRHCDGRNVTVLVFERPFRVGSYFLSGFSQEMHWAGLTRYVEVR